MGSRLPGAIGEANDTIGRHDDNHHEAHTDERVEPLVKAEAKERDAAGKHVHEDEHHRSHEGANGIAETADHRDDQDIDRA